VLSYSPAARKAFRVWLQKRYGDANALNAAWGTVFWSQEYRSFDEVDPPVGTVTEANPAHRLDYRRFASAEVVAFNRVQSDILRKHSPGRDITHNFMGFFTEFDHHDLSQDLDVATWDSYPLGFTQDFFLTAQEKRHYARTGHPDIPAFHHDLYRGMCNGRWWVMEQQPGPVNWAQWNPAPLDGMVRLWTWQAFAHGAEVVSYFRWRQAPFAQEQMHAGLNRPDRSVDQGGLEAAQVAGELQALGIHQAVPAIGNAKAAIIFDYPSIWMAQIQPQGADFNPIEIAFRAYSALRALGVDVDIVSSQAELDAYRLVVLPAHMREDEALATRLAQSKSQVVFGPRSGAKNQTLSFAAALPPGAFSSLAGVKVQRAESLPPGVNDAVQWVNGHTSSNSHWRDHVEPQGATAVASFADGKPAVLRHGNSWYCAGWPDAQGWSELLGQAVQAAGIDFRELAPDVRTTRRGDLLFVQNFSSSEAVFVPPDTAHCLLGAREVAPQGLAIWKLQASA
jgi:beta-galactosidase